MTNTWRDWSGTPVLNVDEALGLVRVYVGEDIESAIVDGTP